MDDGFKVHLNSTGAPFLTKRIRVPMYEKDAPPDKRPYRMRSIRNDVLELWKEEDKKRYDAIWEAAGLELVMVADEERKYIESESNWKVFIRWVIPTDMDPREIRGARYDILNVLTGLKRMDD